ncbi:dehydrogenase [Aspergillus pseudoustus]|uniref:Dehydrogenase n=1 Tax=Aspergillus pseudoustus TaxID=1810923 RepID=A0ABR4JBD9_9EURO
MGGMLGFLYNQLTFTPKPLPESINLSGKTALITGGNIGLGLEAAKQLAERGLSRLILGVRTISKGEAARDEIQRQSPDCEVVVWPLDMESFESIKAFGERVRKLERLDIVILSAGIKALEYKRAPTGHEAHIQVNHLATSLLSLLVLPTLRKTASTHSKNNKPTRLTIVTSEVHFWSRFPDQHAPQILLELDEPSSFGAGMERYNTSKLLNILWVRELSNRVAGRENDNGHGSILINGVNPGLCASELHRSHTTPGVQVFNKVFAWTPRQGGSCLVDAAVVQMEQGGYVSEQVGKRPSPFVLSEQGGRVQKKLWEETMGILSEVVPGIDLLSGL